MQLRPVQRRLEPEILDSLPPAHPDALKSRRDLRVINRVMGNARWFRSALASHVRPGERVLELGSGTGELARSLRPVAPLIDSIDRVPTPPAWPASARWHQADICDFAGWNEYPVVIGNLILHHFTDEALAKLGAALRPHARLLVFSEPTRKRFNQRFWDFITPLVGAHPVTQHDGSVSIAAGFRADELPLALGLDPQLWQWRITSSCLGAYRVIAERRP
ncbi:MAG: methyltransferase domain-containing protein [Opitutaceae bacterium]